jgi:HSP20 family protein
LRWIKPDFGERSYSDFADLPAATPSSIEPHQGHIMSNPRLRETFTDPFENAFRRLLAPLTLDTEAPAMTMKLDVTEKDGAYNVQAELPGVRKEDIQVRVDGNLVQIDAECRSDREQKEGERVLRKERYYGSISRAFTLASDIDDSKVEAKYADGILTLLLPKKAAQTGNKINIQ